jgi:hypothetical protein
MCFCFLVSMMPSDDEKVFSTDPEEFPDLPLDEPLTYFELMQPDVCPGHIAGSAKSGKRVDRTGLRKTGQPPPL